MLLQIVSPNPIPWGLISEFYSIFPNTLNILSLSSSLIPIPESSIENLTYLVKVLVSLLVCDPFSN